MKLASSINFKLLFKKEFFVSMILIFLGVGLRLLAAARGHNYDFDSYLIVIEIASRAGNIYAETTRYNYSPVWSQILVFIYTISFKNVEFFRYALAFFLSFVDISIFIILWKKTGKWIAYLFFLNPISIIITGYHNQFDNLAVLLAMISMLLLRDDSNKHLDRRKYLGLFVLGLSLTVKHVFFIYPVWLMIKQKGFVPKIITLFLPITLFLLSFIPYLKDGTFGIVRNVFLYDSLKEEFFYKLFVPSILQIILTSRMTWIVILTICAFFFQKKENMEALFIYTGIMVATSPSIANQYLAIAMPFIVANLSFWSIMYMILGTWHLLFDSDGLHFPQLSILPATDRTLDYALLTVLLCLSLAWYVWHAELILLLKIILNQIKTQLEINE